MTGSARVLAAFATLLVACESRRPDAAPPGGAISAPSARPAPAPASSAAPSAQVAPSAAAAPSASASSDAALAPWLVGTWRGSSSTYAAPDGDQQRYARKDVVVTIAGDGAFSLTVGHGEDVGANAKPATSSCEAAGTATFAGKRLDLRIARTTCPHGKVGEPLEVEVTRVGACMVQWEKKRGTTPFAHTQIALRRSGCSP